MQSPEGVLAPPPERIRTTIRGLASAQKPATGAPAYSRFVNRKAGRVIAAYAHHLGLTPNTVTAVSALWSAVGIALLATAVRPGAAIGVAVTACLAIGYAFDAADGQLARLRGGGSPAGEWLDHVVDSAKICSLHLAVLICFYRSGSAGRELVIPLAWAFVASVAFFVFILTDQIRRSHAAARPLDGPAPLWRSLLVAPTDYGVLLLTFVLLGLHTAFLWAYGLLLLANIGYLGLGLVKWFRELSALPSHTTTGATA